MSQFDPPITAVRDAVRRALAEDLEPLGDVTAALLPDGATVGAAFVPRGEGVLAGSCCAREVLAQVDLDIEIDWRLEDGALLEGGEVIAIVSGPLASILTAERTALNFLCHLSGIASLTRRYVRATRGKAQLWDTRKTTPGLRSLEKAAVRAGGGVNHRGNLSEWVLLKDNHLGGVTIADAVRRARLRWPGRTVQVEADRLDQVEQAIAAGADIVLLDNMGPDELRRAVALRGESTRPLLEASGGITLDTIGAIAETGIDLVSASAITASAPVLDIGLDLI